MPVIEVEVVDEHGNPTGEVVDARTIHMTDETFNPDFLDEGIRETVIWLRSHGFHTVDSGDGSKCDEMECAQPFPNVYMVVPDPTQLQAETDRLFALLGSFGIEVQPPSDEGEPHIDGIYNPALKEAFINLFHVNDDLLDLHGAITRQFKRQ